VCVCVCVEVALLQIAQLPPKSLGPHSLQATYSQFRS